MAKLNGFLLFCAVMVFTFQCEAYQMSKCKLVKELRKHRFPENQLRDWVCLVEHESARRTHAVGPPNADGSRDYGLFQINDRYWCINSRKPGNACHATCNDMKKKNIRKAAKCAKKIFKIHNFKAWYGWVNNCQGKALPDISSC